MLEQCFSTFVLAVPLCMVRLLEVGPEATGDDIIAVYFQVGKPDVTDKHQEEAKGAWDGFLSVEKHVLELCLSYQASNYCCHVAVLLPGSRDPGVPCKPPDSTSSSTGGTRSTGWETLYLK